MRSEFKAAVLEAMREFSAALFRVFLVIYSAKLPLLGGEKFAWA